MYSFYIVRAGQIAPDPRVAKAISNFGYGQEDAICIATNGYVGEIQSVRSAQITLNRYDISDPNQLGQLLVDKCIAQQAEQAAQAQIADPNIVDA